METKKSAEIACQTRKARANKAKWQLARRIARKTYRCAKTAYENGQLSVLEAQLNQGEQRQFCRGISNKRRGYQEMVDMCKDSLGQIISEKEKVLDRWAKYRLVEPRPSRQRAILGEKENRRKHRTTNAKEDSARDKGHEE